MLNILVLGGTQFFGKRLVEKLIEEGMIVTIATRGRTMDPFGEKVERLVIDRENKSSLETAFEGRTWDVVYDQSCFSPQEARDTAEALKGKVKRYIFTSSMAVYDFGENHKEEDFNPKEFTFSFKSRREYPGYAGYQEAKRASEAYLFQNTDFEVVAVRFPIVIGKDDYTDRLKFHVEKVLKNEPIGIRIPQAKYSFITSGDAADFLLKIGRDHFTGPINPGCKEDISMLELVKKMESMAGGKAVIDPKLTKENASPYGMDGSWSLNTDRANQLGCYFADLHETLDMLIQFYLLEELKLS